VPSLSTPIIRTRNVLHTNRRRNPAVRAERYPVRPGDVALCPAGGAETAHQLINTSASDELRYLAISTMNEPDVAEYPDSNKFAVLSGSAPGGDKSKRRLSFVGRSSGNVDYYAAKTQNRQALATKALNHTDLYV
jgi:hypothetical protein